ncbi:MAG: HAD family hydrolase [Chloroflexi bacterium]|nr:HAD family hydrolase [Chloroflexota bacterium]
MPKLRALVFDVFNTLAQNPREKWFATFQEVCRTQALQTDVGRLFSLWHTLEADFRRRRVDPQDLARTPPFQSYYEAWSGCFRDAFHQLGLDGDAGEAARMAVEALGQRPLFPETLETLHQLRGRVLLGVLSNADDAFLLPLLANHGLTFDAVVSSEQARAYKPHPVAFHRVLGLLGVAPHEAMQVGDMLAEDVLGARTSGMEAAWVNRSGARRDPDLPTPDYEIASLTELLDIVSQDGQRHRKEQSAGPIP